MLTPFVLNRHCNPGRLVRQADGGFGFVHVLRKYVTSDERLAKCKYLASSAARAHHIDFDFSLVQYILHSLMFSAFIGKGKYLAIRQ